MNPKRANLWAAILVVLLCLVSAAVIAVAARPLLVPLGPSSGGPTQPPLDFPHITTSASPAPSEPPTLSSTPSPSPTPAATFTTAASSTALASFTPGSTPTALPTSTSTETPTEIPTVGPSPTALPTDTPEPIPPTPLAARLPAPRASTSSGGVHWIDVDLTNQLVTAYEGDTVVNTFLVSTGATPRLTVTGSYHVYERHIQGNMWGPGYFLPDVPYIMYFHKGYALHGTYWHSNFGTPMSHGCVNLSIPDAEWLYNWSAIGTLVKVHY